MTTPYQKGVRVEYLLANELREQGWTVIRSAGSKGPADLVAWKEPDAMFLQVKACKSLAGVRRAIKAAIRKFDLAGVFDSAYIFFGVYVRYNASWLIVWRDELGWCPDRFTGNLLGQTEWPITEQEEQDD